MTSKRPSSVTSLLFVVLSLTAWNAIRLGASIADWDALAEFAPRPGPLYIAATAAFWTLSGLLVTGFILHRNSRAPLIGALNFFGYAAWWWADRLLLQAPRSNAEFALAASLSLMAYVLYLTFHRKTREFFQPRESHDQTNTNTDPA